MTTMLLDTTDRTLTGATIRSHGYDGVCRYVLNAPGSEHLDKELLETEIREKSAAGCRIVSNFEWAAKPVNTAAEGRAHARAFLDSPAGRLGPDWSPCYYSVDTAARAGAYDNYAHGWADVLTPERCGVYGDGALYRALLKAWLVHWAWQSMSSSFPGNSSTSGANIVQTHRGTVDGHNVDFNEIMTPLYGGWLLGEPNPMEGSDMPLTKDDVTLVLNALKADPSYLDLTWRVHAIANALDTYAAGSMKGDPVGLTRMLKAIPTTPVDPDKLAAAIAAKLPAGAVDVAAVKAALAEVLTGGTDSVTAP